MKQCYCHLKPVRTLISNCRVAYCIPRYYEIAALKDPQSRGGSEEVYGLNIGDVVKISEPKNHFPLRSKEAKSLLIADGIGVIRLLPMAQTLQCAGTPVEFQYCGKSPHTAAFSETLKRASIVDKMHFHFSGEPQSSGRMDIKSILSQHVTDSDLYVCGPAEFIASVLEHAQKLEWPEDKVHRKFFATPTIEAEHTENHAFQIKVTSTGQISDVAANQSIADMLDEQAIFVPVSCCEAVCETCLTDVISGEIEHRDVFLSKQEKQQENKC